MNELKEQIEEARRMVKITRDIAGRPGAAVEDELRHQNARNWLLSLEIRVLNSIVALQRKNRGAQNQGNGHQPSRMTAKERAEHDFAALTKGGA